MNEKIKYLKNSPLYNMSLASMELFHSNFWAWLMEKDSRFINVFFDVSTNNITSCKILRESHHRDIVICIEDEKVQKEYIIENKLKSLPYKEQLYRYETGTKNFKSGIITGIIEPDFKRNNECENWTFLSYHTISKKLRTTDYLNGEYKLILNMYCDVVDALFYVLNNHLEESDFKYDLCYKEPYSKFIDIRLHDIVKKLKMADFKMYFDEHYRNEVSCIIPNYELVTKVGFSNGQAIMDIFFENLEGLSEKERIKIGIQIQDGQYRRVVEVPGVSTINTFKKYLGCWFEERTNNSIFGLSTSMSKDYCEYKPSFVYQYWNISENSSLQTDSFITYDTLCKQIVSDLSKINII